ncbi:MAG: Trm112 family protein [Gemmatimonadota bacterium]|nr:Trm112 family protein [Gemmatimonadota bacterium]
MFIELLELLRCTSDHAESSLVAAFSKVTNRFVDEATLGCPVCGRKFPIASGIGQFGAETAVKPAARNWQPAEREELATRIGAFLNATEAGSTVLLGGVWAGGAQMLSEMVELRVFALNPPAGVHESANVGLLAVAEAIPLAAGSCAGAALDDKVDPGLLPSILRMVRAGGRIVGPTAIPPPATVLVLAKDDSYWVAQKAPEVTPLRRASR